MANHPRSFRRNLLLRILAFSLPILFIGQAVVLRKARTSLLTTARQNLTSSAIRKAEELEKGIQSVEANLDLLAQTEAFQSGDVDAIETLLIDFARESTAYTISCVELRSPKAKTSVINTCDSPSNPARTIVPTAKLVPWLQDGSVDESDFYVFSPGLSAAMTPIKSEDIPPDRALVKFVVASPIYDSDGNLSYT
ncbi:MAG: hypothetical protein AAFU53_15930, partial [Cyanobacteria bacterium J06632_3]